MGRLKENPRYNVVSMRLNDSERERLDEILKASGKKTVGDVLRAKLFGARKGRA